MNATRGDTPPHDPVAQRRPRFEIVAGGAADPGNELAGFVERATAFCEAEIERVAFSNTEQAHRVRRYCRARLAVVRLLRF